MIMYGQKIEWRGLDGSVSAVEVNECESPQEAIDEAIKSAKAFGWSPPRWWQWWRWSEPIRNSRS